ncbi:hypothetical protein [Micromonospora sp. NPDC050495]|uniref:hypothetical protein n=1 Tax=Micromonospora sp. NPDC050495 TaxID=3154936 RepID=UPI0033C07A24
MAVACAGLVGCSGDRSTEPVALASGVVDGGGWTLVAFRNEAGELCLDLRDAAMKRSYSGGCGGWAAEPGSGAYVDGTGPGVTEFAYGPLRETVGSVEASAAGRDPVVVPARAMPGGSGAAKFFVMAFPDAATDWTYTARNAAGGVDRLGTR